MDVKIIKKTPELPFIFSVDVRAVLKQQLNDSVAIVSSGQMQRSRPPAVTSVTINI